MVSSKASFGVMGLSAVMLAIMIMAGGVAGQGPAPAPAAADCDTVVVQLLDCLPYVSGAVSTPTATCCTNLSAIIVATPQCLCQLYNTTFTEPLGVNVTRALELPPACKLTTPDPSLCTLIGIPVAGPVVAPVSPAGPAVAPSSVPTPSVLPAAPTTAPSTAPTTSSSPVAAPPGTEMSPNTAAASPPSPNSAPSLTARSIAAASSIIFALTLIFR